MDTTDGEKFGRVVFAFPTQNKSGLFSVDQGNNLTVVTEFFLLGFQGSQYVRSLLFCLFLVIYCGTICGNFLIITLTFYDIFNMQMSSLEQQGHCHLPLSAIATLLLLKRVNLHIDKMCNISTETAIHKRKTPFDPERGTALCNFNVSQSQLMHDTCRLLVLFEEATLFVSHQDYGMNNVIPLIHILEKMLTNNLTVVTEFLLLGFQVSQGFRIYLFCLLLMIYCGTICGNLLIITLVSTSKNLHTPMYFFISQLSISDIIVITDIVPNLLHVLLNNGAAITFIDCITQLYFLCSTEAFECFLLAVMSYDRYLAICNPLRYFTIMAARLWVILSTICWLLGSSMLLIYIVKIGKLSFCGPNVIDHLFCDLIPILDLACSDTFVVHMEIYFMGIPVVIIPTTIIVVSYTYIVWAVLRIPSSTGRQKAFSTCSSHLIVVSIFYWTMFGVYVVPTNGLTLSASKILSLLYTVFTPFINPIIYSLRNKDIRKAIKEILYKINTAKSATS
ncbi:olfactory receptor 1468-like [Leptodactylus fuscus]